MLSNLIQRLGLATLFLGGLETAGYALSTKVDSGSVWFYLILGCVASVGALASRGIKGDTARSLSQIYVIDALSNFVIAWFAVNPAPAQMAAWLTIGYLFSKHTVALVKIIVICWVPRRQDTGDFIGFPNLLPGWNRVVTSTRVDPWAWVSVAAACVFGFSANHYGYHTNGLVWITPCAIVLGFAAFGLSKQIDAWESALKKNNGYSADVIEVARQFAVIIETSPKAARALADGIRGQFIVDTQK